MMVYHNSDYFLYPSWIRESTSITGVDLSKYWGTHIFGGKVIITDESLEVSQLLGRGLPGLPTKVYPYDFHPLPCLQCCSTILWNLWLSSAKLGLPTMNSLSPWWTTSSYTGMTLTV